MECKCVMCFVCGKIESVKYFTEATFKKCKDSLAIRIKFHLGHENVELPDDVNSNIGYHPRPQTMLQQY